ncbi:neutral and basic amino acid transport protein rBAT-like [Chrysoperla carnea]|uniref:neutral and basic amino acid transport protein rBAT-like n=1 Tax=Chrysoperla carnea TaxID=189513 RepID=UPI001D094923|nr:neutral and basic amino acid transport protein rBAT-like [Chrysoperla carnea]XP_044731983.1 neutral and basic amino acid transport protein rBAT-like [Chrysoperla carnea]XP_044731984.1 neutral and basic amino acid transport protein rBAT-like [Chrysoperla carnea]XP_044731985.1 neutral and basic amino acid transport protein rBAT-like [Chrysoperla carnea]
MNLDAQNGLLNLPSTSLSVTDASGAYLKDADVASTCPLLTPSPPTNALVNPSAGDLDTPTSPIIDGAELTQKLKKVEQGDLSSSNSSVAEPASVQLLHNYLTLTKTAGDGIALQENGTRSAKDVPYERKVENMFFFKWNWPLIRKFCVFGTLLSVLSAVVLVISMVVTLPKTCNPPVKWYQGGLLYEIFPASFQDSNGDEIGDLRGIVQRVEYIKSLGVRGIRLNSIFPAPHYPENFHNISTLFDIEHNLGTMADFENLIKFYHSNEIKVIIDLPVWPLHGDYQQSVPEVLIKNETFHKIENSVSYNQTATDEEQEDSELVESETTITKAIRFWLNHGVDGFYLKGIEKFVHDPYFAQSIREWKLLCGSERILIVNYDTFKLTPKYMHSILLNRIDLVDIKLNFDNGADGLRNQIEQTQEGILWSKPSAPWVQWSTGNVDSHRLSSMLQNTTLGAILIQFILPGTPSLFYGDEIALGEVIDSNGERADLKHLHQLTTMLWQKNDKSNHDSRHNSLPWLPGKPEYKNFNYINAITKMTKLRMENPTIYVNGIWKDSIITCNAAVRYSGNNILVIERWYPRRNTFVIVSNLSNMTQTVDLSSLYYSGTVIVATNTEIQDQRINFNFIRLRSGDSIVLKLDK